MKAFLSHSSSDKELVRAVAKALGRQYCLFDEQCFETGSEFKTSIEKALNDTDVFVLFASKAALESIWVKFEIDQAWMRKLREQISRSLVFVVDTKTEFDALPEWLQRARAVKEISPNVIARTIRHHLDQLLRDRQQKFFVGRALEQQKVQSALVPDDATEAPRIFCVYGLPGVGRRSLIRRVASDVLNLRRTIELRIESGTTLGDLAVQLAFQITPFHSRKHFEESASEIRRLSTEHLADRAVADLRTIVSGGELPILVDYDGAIESNSGNISNAIKPLLARFAKDDEAYLAIVTERRPKDFDFPVIQIDPMNEGDVKMLLSTISRDIEFPLKSPQLKEIADYVKGYPPGAIYAMQFAKNYGIDVLLAGKRHLVEFRVAHFLKHLQKIDLVGHRKTLLRVLSTYSPLPLRALGELLAVSAEDLAKDLVWLMDRALVSLDRFGHYRVADPVTDAVEKITGFVSTEESESIVGILEKEIREADDEEIQVELLRVLFRARARSGAAVQLSAFHFDADTIRLAKEFYYSRDYDRSLQYARLALDAQSDNPEAWVYYIQSLIQLEQWAEAERQIVASQTVVQLRDQKYLHGFLCRKRGDPHGALADYLKSLELGRNGVAIHRELAQCYFSVGKLDEAEKHIRSANERRPDNRFVIDLQVQIATKLRNEANARDGLARLEFFEQEAFYKHRSSTVELRFGDPGRAFELSYQALKVSERPTFEMRAQFIKSALRYGKLDAAEEELARLDKMGIRADIRAGLRSRLLMAKGRFEDALELSDQIEDKSRPVHKLIRRDAIIGILRNSAIADVRRQKMEEELKSLEVALAKPIALGAVDLDFDIDERN